MDCLRYAPPPSFSGYPHAAQLAPAFWLNGPWGVCAVTTVTLLSLLCSCNAGVPCWVEVNLDDAKNDPNKSEVFLPAVITNYRKGERYIKCDMGQNSI